jgi:endo-1,4-beta-xylanase
MTRYKGRIGEWIVVNEALGSRNVDGLMLSPTIWLDLIGPDYVTLAFRHARKVDPDAVLIINDYGADYFGQDRGSGAGARVDAYYSLVVHLLADGAPIDGVGFQFHLEVGRDRPSVQEIVDNMARYHAIGLSTHITELDARIRKPVTQAKLVEQARLYETVFRAALESAACEDIVLWGFSDRYSWITAGETFPDHAAGTIMDDKLRPRPAFDAVHEALQSVGFDD